MKALVQSMLGQFGLRLIRTGTPPQSFDPYADLPRGDRATIAAVSQFTMTSPERLAALIAATRYVVERRIPGDIVECGVWRGGSMMAVALTLLTLGETHRRLILYDTFEGMPAPSQADTDVLGRSASKLLRAERRRTGATIWAYATIDDVRQNLLSTGYPIEQIVFVTGKVEETIPAALPEQIALLRLDTDWYESTLHEMRHLYPRLSPWGPLVIDDYGHWQGARRAVDEFAAMLPHPLYLHRVDYTARVAIKPGSLS